MHSHSTFALAGVVLAGAGGALENIHEGLAITALILSVAASLVSLTKSNSKDKK